jgi:hypothetical protein
VTVVFEVDTSGGTPTGTVTVDDDVDSCTATVAAGQCTMVLTKKGHRNLKATYGGDSTFEAAVSPGEAHKVQ